MDRNAAITAARAVIEAAGLKQEDLFPASACAREQEQGIDDLLPRRRWVPEIGEKYFCVWGGYKQEVRTFAWDNGHFGRAAFAFGNCFRTREEAEAKRAEIVGDAG